jgi:two-component system CheB/CheR fusion protein
MTIEAALPKGTGKTALPARLPLRELTEQTLLQQFAPVAALVNGAGDILYLHGRTGMFLEPAPGESGVNNILRMAREGLAAGSEDGPAQSGQTPARSSIARGWKVKTNGHFARVDLTVCPVPADPDAMPSPLYLVMLQEAVATDQAQPAAGSQWWRSRRGP